ncbi:MAG: RNA 2',3'-cyclic phosphodiesterase [Alphaproteobacteria bacterium]|nr:RNA 2',3'-cyclic phosphodiesterase [Alphaproteobacteria bacterium]
MIRLFVGLEIPENIKNQVLSLDKNLTGALWKSDEKLHLTLFFVGNVEEPRAEELMRELRFIRFPAFHLALKEIGFFANGDMPHHLWAGVEETKALGELQEKVAAVVRKVGLAGQDKFKFHPHVTLARLQGVSVPAVMDYISRNNLFHSDLFEVTSFSLFSSHAKENGEGKHYKVEAEYPLDLI